MNGTTLLHRIMIFDSPPSDTPLTDGHEDPDAPLGYVSIEFARKLERKLHHHEALLCASEHHCSQLLELAAGAMKLIPKAQRFPWITAPFRRVESLADLFAL